MAARCSQKAWEVASDHVKKYSSSPGYIDTRCGTDKTLARSDTRLSLHRLGSECNLEVGSLHTLPLPANGSPAITIKVRGNGEIRQVNTKPRYATDSNEQRQLPQRHAKPKNLEGWSNPCAILDDSSRAK